MNTGELCGSMFWLLLNQRFHFLDPDNEAYVAEMERSLYNVGFANQVPDGPRIRYFARLHGYKQPGYAIGTPPPLLLLTRAIHVTSPVDSQCSFVFCPRDSLEGEGALGAITERLQSGYRDL